MKKNLNFEIEISGTNSLFFVDRENGKGYYVENLNLQKLSLLEENDVYLEKLIMIGYYINDNTISKAISKNRWQNSLFPELKVNEVRLFIYLIVSYIVLLSTILFLFIKFPLVNNLAFTATVMDYIIVLILFYSGVYLVHEYFHVIIAKIQGIEIRKIGFKVKYYIFPIAYVQFMPTSKDKVRANIAFAGNVADLILLLIYYLIYLTTHSIHFYYVLFFQILMTFWNYNPFLPTDFLIFILSYCKIPSFRVKALKLTKNYIVSLLSMKFKRINLKDSFYLGYGICNYLFFAYIFYCFIKELLNVF